MMFITGNFRQSALPSFEEVAAQIEAEQAGYIENPVFPPGTPRRIDGKVDGFNCDPDCQCPGCLMGFGCYSCGCQS